MQAIKDLGYLAQAQGCAMADNPYSASTQSYWAWRQGFIEAFTDSSL